MFVFFLFWLIGMGVTILYRRTVSNKLINQDIILTLIMSGVIGFVFSYAARQANMSGWVIHLLSAAAGFIVTYKLLEKAKK